MRFFLTILLAAFLTLSRVESTRFMVNTTQELKAILRSSEVKPGDHIQLKDGVYDSSETGSLSITISGNETHSIYLNGSRNAILTRGDQSQALSLNNANYWNITGITFANSRRGIVLQSSSFNVFQDISIYNMAEEGVRIKTNSTDNSLIGSDISNTRRGISIGTHAGGIVDGQLDHSDRTEIKDNYIGPFITDQLIDLKEDTRDGIVKGNRLNGTGQVVISYTNSLITIKGSNYTIISNVAYNALDDNFRLNPRPNSDPNSGCLNRIMYNWCTNEENVDDPCVKTTSSCENEVSNNFWLRLEK